MHILIADDVAVVRRSVWGVLAEAFPHARFAEARNGDEVMNWLSKSKFCILMLDPRILDAAEWMCCGMSSAPTRIYR